VTSGGARVRSGPPRDPNAIRRGRSPDRSGFEYLPAAGREGAPPAWPLPGRPTKFERDRWTIEWTKPQAVMWERLGWDVQVAMYIRTLRVASSGKAAATVTSNALRQMDMLGLSRAGLAANRWIIEDAPPAAAAPRRAPGASAKERLSVITGGSRARAS
jgi:hypothetical protein